MIIPSEIKEYIHLHREEDVRKLALQKSQLSSDMHTFVLQQITGWQIAQKKVPSWANINDIIYPQHLSLEQCSSEQTAQYKASLLQPAATFVDLTGGMGVDFSFMGRKFQQAIYVEQNDYLCQLAAHNFPLLKLNALIKNEKSESAISQLSHADVIYLDPARRDEKGRKVVSIADCTPNLLEIKDLLLEKSSSVWIKYSPMLDISLAIKELGNVDAVHVVSFNNECKELLFHLSNENNTHVNVSCVNLKKDSCEKIEYQWNEEQDANLKIAQKIGSYLYEPNASIMKAGAFKIITNRYNVYKLGVCSHLYTSDTFIEDFPGRKFKVLSSFTMNKQQIKENLSDCKQANVAVRNFPLSAEQLKDKLKIKDGGKDYLFATTFCDQKILIKAALA